VPEQHGQIGVDEPAIQLHRIAVPGPADVDDAVRVLGVVVDDPARVDPLQRLRPEQVGQLVGGVLTVQADRADQADVARPDTGLLQLVQHQRHRDPAVGRLVGAALHPVRERDGHP
jgi:hypothetical protein